MTIYLSAPSAGSPRKFDSGPLSWVMDEVREALNQSKSALQNAMGKDKDAADTLLNQAGAYLHQAHGALQIVDVEGASVITECVEDILRRVVANELFLQRTTLRALSLIHI